MTYFPPQNGPLPETPHRAPWDVYTGAHESFVIGYNDILARDPRTGRVFLPVRSIEPEKGKPWLFGGRTTPGESVEESSARHFRDDTGMDIAPHRFHAFSHWDIAHQTPGQEPPMRHARNVVSLVDLTPSEAERLSQIVASDELRPGEYSGGEWFDPDHDSYTNLPDPIKETLRDLFSYTVTMDGIREVAEQEYEQRYGTRPPVITSGP
jgi:hypothetical protein